MLEYQLTVLQNSMMRAGQKLHMGKCLILYAADADDRPRPRPWSPQELRKYRRTGLYLGSGLHNAAIARMASCPQLKEKANARTRMASEGRCPHGTNAGQATETLARHGPSQTRMAGSQREEGGGCPPGESGGPHGLAQARMAGSPVEERGGCPPGADVVRTASDPEAVGGEAVPHGVAQARMASRSEEEAPMRVDRMAAVGETVALGTR